MYFNSMGLREIERIDIDCTTVLLKLGFMKRHYEELTVITLFSFYIFPCDEQVFLLLAQLFLPINRK